jgi:hypothetical protein
MALGQLFYQLFHLISYHIMTQLGNADTQQPMERLGFIDFLVTVHG